MAVMCWIPSGTSAADPGSFDVNFGGDGVITASHEDDAEFRGVLAQGDRVTFIGKGMRPGTSGNATGVIVTLDRILPDGRRDTSFGDRGSVVLRYSLLPPAPITYVDSRTVNDPVTVVPGRGDSVIAVTSSSLSYQPDAEQNWWWIDRRYITLTEVTANGGLDATFGDGGVRHEDLEGAGIAIASVNDAKTDTDGRIIVLGTTTSGRVFVARFDASGSLDLTYGTGGVVVPQDPDPSREELARSLEIASDGRLYVLGWSVYGPAGSRNFVMRMQPDGTVDPSFSGGVVVMPLPESGEDVWVQMALDGGRIYLVGSNEVFEGRQQTLVGAIADDGTWVSSFGNDGIVTLTPTDEFHSWGSDIAVSTAGMIVVGGTLTPDVDAEPPRGFTARLNSDGSLDLTYHGDGVKALPPQGSVNAVYRIGIDMVGNGYAVGAGYSNGGSHAAAVRICGNVLDSTPGMIGDASGGADEVFGSCRGDEISGGDGDDQLAGMTGYDTLAGGAGDDVLRGGVGADSLRGDGGDDAVMGGTGADSIFGGLGADSLFGGSGDDLLKGGPGPDILSSSYGDDRISSSDGAGGDRVSCGEGYDIVYANRGDSVARDCERIYRV